MPSRKSRSKEDTWTTAELDSALKEDREKQRQERREKREKKEKSSTRDEKPRVRKDKVITNDDADKDRKRHRERDDKGRKERTVKDDRNREAEREERRKRQEDERIGHHKVDDESRRKERKQREREKERDEDHVKGSSERHKRRDDHDDDREKRRSERHKNRELNNHDIDDKRDRHKRRENDRDEKRSGMSKYSENGDEKRDRRSEKNADDRRRSEEKKYEENERDKRHREKRELKEAKSSTSKREEEQLTVSTKNGHQSAEESDGDNYDDDDFEDYDDDFEEDDDDDDADKERKPMDREMSDILKALDEENARLASGSGTPRSNRSDSFDKYDKKEHERPFNVNRGRTFINFVSAKQRAVDQKVSNKTKKRGQDLLKLIEFDKAGFDMFELPPVKEYELYIRSFGRTDTKQAYIQTNEDNLDRDIQTEEIEYRDKWTQHPAEDLHGCGGDNIDSTRNEETHDTSIHDISRMSAFLTKAAQAIGILLNEESQTSNDTGVIGNKSNISISNGYAMLTSPSILQGRYVNYATYSASQPNMLLTSYSSPQQISDNPADTKGLLCVWNVMEPSNPQKILACESQPMCCCFSPVKATLACAGMMDGSIVIWDLREQASIHNIVKFQQEEYHFRYPTYNTAGVSESENHHSPVRTLLPVYPDPTSSVLKQEEAESSVSGLSFQLASVEENAFLNLWVVAEIPSTDYAGSEIDLGLSPGGRIKLVKSSTIKLTHPSQADHGQPVQAYEFQFSPCDLNHFYVGTDTGYVVHGVRFGSSAFPRGYTSVIDTPIKVMTLDFSPFGYPYMLAGCCDGSLHLYHTKLENPLVSWTDLNKGKSNSIICVRWSRSRAGVFFVLDDQSMLYTFDLLEGDSRPIHVDEITSGKAVYMVLNNDSGQIGSGSASRSPQLFLALDNGTTELHNIKQNLVEQQTLEMEYLHKFNERF